MVPFMCLMALLGCSLRGRSLPLVIGAALALSAWQYASGTRMRAVLDASRQVVADMEKAIGERDEAIKRLQRNAREQAAQQARLADRHRRIAAALSSRQSELETLHHENTTLREWFDRPLPDTVVRMYAFAARSGVHGDDREPLRVDHAVCNAGDVAAREWGPVASAGRGARGMGGLRGEGGGDRGVSGGGRGAVGARG